MVQNVVLDKIPGVVPFIVIVSVLPDLDIRIVDDIFQINHRSVIIG
ncbi:hypothetical protein SDC9_207258 [bioreactor metagenome]|uniref:Uncharacterized protein n=1 Tax=bioreactor metagenome TaxID=1076179 RepID=A0A645J814_9ZZZZ